MIPVIDLGEVRAPPDEPEPPARTWIRPPLLLLTVLLLAALGGAAVPRYGLVSLFAVPVDAVAAHALTGDTLYVAHARDVTAYRLPAGTPGWSAATARRIGVLIPVATAGVVLAQYEGDSDLAGMLALDARTGRVLWQDPQARLLGAVPGASRALLLHLAELRAVDVPTGRTIWERPRGLGLGWAMPDLDTRQNTPPRLAFDSGDGTTEVVDAASGAVVARSRLESLWPAGVGVSGGGAVTVTTGGFLLAARSVVGGQLFVARQQSGSSVIDAYDLASLAHQWRLTLDPPAFFVTGCGTVLCVDGFASMSGVDPRSGAVRWTSRQWREGRPLPGNRLLLSSSIADMPASIVDAATLRPVRGLVGWFPLAGSAPGRWLIARDAPGLRTWFATLTPDGAGLRPLGWVYGVQISQCEYRDGFVACPTVRDRLQVWRYR
jgi:outer membrane protein assembly factor BamB